MNVIDYLNNKGMKRVPNPKYNNKTKKLGVQPFIEVPDLGVTHDVVTDIAIQDYITQNKIDSKFTKKYENAGLNYNPWENLDKQLAESQSNLTKLGNGIAQAVVSEIGLGTIGATADIFDYIISNIFNLTEKNYQNPISNKIKEWQDIFNNEIAPVYTDPSINIQTGGLTDLGWYAKNIPNIASTLMLLFPAKGISMIAGSLIKGSKLAKGLGNARRWATRINKYEDASEMGKFVASINSFEGIARANKAVEISAEALLMRTAENYQEARETYLPVYDEASKELNKLDDEQLDKLVKSNPNFFDPKKVDVKDRDKLAKYIARNAADRTFTMDFSNIIFDIVQLYGLRNIGKGIKEINRSRKVNKLQKEAIEETGKIKPLKGRETPSNTNTTPSITDNPQETLSVIDKIGAYGKNIARGTYDFAKYQGKTILAESTEGVEEAVNYIAQQEGITYGKMLLAAQTDDYTNSWWTAIPKTWTNINGSLKNYLATPELQESAFWGVAGGVVFGNIGSITNRAKLAIERKAEEKERKEDNITGEQIPTSSITELFESNEDRIARTILKKRVELVERLRGQLEIIEDGRDPFSKPDINGKFEEFKGDKKFRADITKARAISEFRSELAIDAINSGTYELLLDYFKSKEVKQAMVNLGLAEESNIESFVEETIRDLEDAKNEYSRQSAHVLNQVSFLNNKLRRKHKDEANDENIEDGSDISVEYARIIAKNNYLYAQAVKAIEKQLTANGVLEAEQQNILAQFNTEINPITAKEAVGITALLAAYREISVKEKEVQESEANTSIAKIQKFATLEQLKSQKEGILKQLKKRVLANNSNTALGTIFTAFKIEKASTRNKNTGKIEETIPITDKEIISDVRAFFGEELGDVSDESIIQSAKVINSDLNSIVNNKEDGLVNLNPKLFQLYNNSIELEIQKEMTRSLIASSVDQVREQINYYHNIHNEVRSTKVAFAQNIIVRAIEEYNGIIDETTGKDLIPAITEAYFGNIKEAERIANEVMASPGEGAVTATEFMDALKILALDKKSNKLLYDWLMQSINMRARNIRRERTREIQENPTNENQLSAESSGQSINPNPQASNAGRNNPMLSQRQSLNQLAPKQRTNSNSNTNVKLIINNRGNIVSAKLSNAPSSNTFAATTDSNGNTEILADNVDKPNQLKLLKAGLFNIDEDVDLLDDKTDWIVAENPIVKIKNNKPIQIVKKGRISSVASNNSNTQIGQSTAQPTSSSSSPVEDIQPTQLSQPVQAPIPEGASAPIINQNNNNQTAQAPENNSQTPSPIPPAPTPESLPFNTTANSQEQTNSGKQASTNPSTGDVTYREGEDTLIDNDINSEIYTHIPNLLADDIDFDKIFDEVVDAIAAKYIRMSKDDIKSQVKPFIDSVKSARDSAKRFSSAALQTGAGLAYSSKVEDVTSVDFSAPFKAAAEAFLNEYSKLLIVKEIDGKQVVRLEDIMRLIQQASPMSSKEAATFFNIIKNYLTSNPGKYEIIDLNNDENIFNNLNKTSQQVVEAENAGEELRVNIRDIIESEPSDDYFKVLDNLKVGDKVSLVLTSNNNKILIFSNGMNIGSMSIPRVVNDYYLQNNQGWMTDVKSDAQGNPVSEVMEIIRHLFLDDTVDNDKLRELLTRLSITGNNITDNDVDEFSLNPIISNLAQQARARYNANPNNPKTILYIDENGHIDFKRPLLHLVRLWKYTNTSNIDTNKEKIKENISINLNAFYNKLFKTYKAISSIKGGEQAIITKKQGSHAVRVLENSTFDNYDQLPLAGDAIVDKENARISIVNTETTNNITVSGRHNINKPGFVPGRTFLSMYDNNGSVDFVNAFGLRFSDSSADTNNIFNQIKNSALDYFEELLNELGNRSTSNKTTLKDIEDFLNSLIATSNGGNTIPLFRAIKGEFRVEPINYRNSSGSGIKIAYFARGKAPKRFFILDNTQFGSSLGFKIEVGSNSSRLIATSSNRKVENVASSAKNAFSTFLNDIICVNIDANGIISDSTSNTNYNGFINKRNGKLVINIPKENAPLTLEFDSYNDFLIDNNLIRVNTTKSKNGTNFERFGENQRLNSTLFISLPENNVSNQHISERENAEEDKDSVPTNVILDEGTTAENYAEFVKIFENGKVNGEEVVNAILGEQVLERLRESAQSEHLHIYDLIPNTVEFLNNLNDYSLSNIDKQPIAETTGNSANTTVHVYRNGKRTSITRRGRNRTFVGPKFANVAAASLRGRRVNAIKTLMHEKLHNILQNGSNKNVDLLKSLEEVYNDFVRLLKEDINNNKLSTEDKEKLKSLLNVYETEFAKHKELISKGKEPSFRHIEEFLVDSLTNSVLYNYLNSKNVENANNNNKPENLLTRIINAICKFFNWSPAKDGTLLMKELNVIRDNFKENPNTNDNSSDNTATESVENQSKDLNEKEDDEVKEDNKNEKDYKEDEEENDDFYDDFADVLTEEEKLMLSDNDDYSSNKDSMFNDKLAYESTVEDSPSDMLDFIPVGNVDAFTNRLPLDQQAQFTSLVSQGIVETKCR